MAISEAYSGTQTATVTTEHTLNTSDPETTDGIYQVMIDLNAMANGDIVEIRVKEKVLSAGTQRTIFTAVLSDAQSADDMIFVSPAIVLLHGWSVTLKQTAGTGRSFPWSIRKVA